MNTNTIEMIKECSLGDPNAEAFLSATFDFFHCVDDVFDRDKPVAPEEFVMKCLNFVGQVGSNPFYQQNRERFEALIAQAANAWLDSNNGVPGHDVLKSWYHEIFWATAFVKGGWIHMRVVCKRWRTFDLEETNHGMRTEPTSAA